jgi:hypothetical protein
MPRRRQLESGRGHFSADQHHILMAAIHQFPQRCIARFPYLNSQAIVDNSLFPIQLCAAHGRDVDRDTRSKFYSRAFTLTIAPGSSLIGIFTSQLLLPPTLVVIVLSRDVFILTLRRSLNPEVVAALPRMRMFRQSAPPATGNMAKVKRSQHAPNWLYPHTFLRCKSVRRRCLPALIEYFA